MFALNTLVTGGAGFIGSHLVDRLLREGHRVVVVDDLSTGARANLPPGAELHIRDICSPLEEIFRTARPEVVFHLAGQVSVPRSVEDPHRDLQVNTGGTIRVMEEAARWQVRKVVYLSSAAVYGIPRSLPLTEESPIQPISPYGLSKWTAEEYVRLLGGTRGVAFSIIRPANIYGPRQTAEAEGAVVPAFLDRFLNQTDPVIHGRGDQTRDFLYVADMVEALIRAMHAADGLTLNISSGRPVSILDLWQQLADLIGWQRPPRFGPVRPGDIPHSVMENRLAGTALGWEPRYTLAEGLAETLAWVAGRQAAPGQA
ncbi:MAG: NAD-dependent epimerase/dehydratase family protein [Bacillota bacterium]